MAGMEREESATRLNQNLQRAVSRCNELALALKQPLFFQWAKSLDSIRIESARMATAKGRNKIEIESDITNFYGKLAAKQETLQ